MKGKIDELAIIENLPTEIDALLAEYDLGDQREEELRKEKENARTSLR